MVPPGEPGASGVVGVWHKKCQKFRKLLFLLSHLKQLPNPRKYFMQRWARGGKAATSLAEMKGQGREAETVVWSP